MIRYTRGTDGAEIMKEVCVICGEDANTLHIAEVAVKPDLDNRVLLIKDRNDSDQTMKKKRERLDEQTASFIAQGRMDSTDASEFRTKGELKFGMKPEALCSMSIDIITGVTRSFCYRTDNAKFLAKTFSGTTLSASFHASSEEIHTSVGKKVGIDRKGNIIRMKAEKKVDMIDKIAKEDAGDLEYKGPLATTWFRALRTAQQTYLIEGAQSIRAYVERYGILVKDMSVVARYRNRAEFVDAVNNDVARGETSLR
tara:strand:+ start:3273 stop:4037 length:765 start_codon:yes stop_codon:yes gene_type:complete